MKKFSKDWMGVSSVPCILSILKKQDAYGYEINKQLRDLSQGKIDWKEGSLYTVLKKMEDSKYIKSYWNVKDYDRPRKYYKITSTGEKALIESQENLAVINQVINFYGLSS